MLSGRIQQLEAENRLLKQGKFSGPELKSSNETKIKVLNDHVAQLTDRSEKMANKISDITELYYAEKVNGQVV